MSVKELLAHIASLQSTGTEVYAAGVFPSQRYHAFLGMPREDDNVFFTVCIVHILQQLDGSLDADERLIARSICEAALAAFPSYRNKDGLDTYNYWRTKPSRHFPNGVFMHRYTHFRIPDDIDDTALIFFAQNASRERVGQLRERLKGHANLAYRPARNPPLEYQHLKVYSTFIGKNMYIDMDVCVLSNLMRLILTHFPHELNDHDRDSLHFICEVVRKGQNQSIPFQIAPQYSTTPLILYHIARLLPLLPEEYQDIRPIIIADLLDAHNRSSGMNRVLLENALLKLGERISTMTDYSTELSKEKDFFYCIAGMLTAFEGALVQRISVSPFWHLRFRSEAFNLALLLENKVLRRAIS